MWGDCIPVCTSGNQNRVSSVPLLELFLARLEGRKPQQSAILLSLPAPLGGRVTDTAHQFLL